MRTYPPDSLNPDPAHHFSGKVLLLAGTQTFSAAEDTVVVFRTSHRGLILGQPTGGSSGQPLSFSLPGGGTARVCTKHDAFPDGTEFVGVGVPPDRLIEPTRQDLIHNTDPVMAAAQSLAAQP